MQSLQYPFATQDWSLGTGRALTLQASQVVAIEALSGSFWITVSGSQQDFFIAAGERLPIPCQHGEVVLEALTGAATARIAQHATAPRAVGSGFTRAVAVSLLAPLAHHAGQALRRVANWLDPLPARA
ncbi:MAG: DUF2917 domain-containing protein [Burkholderiales bacterium]|nr:DUF2917 domain-containing protein [Burkholderiales bacterium]